MERMELIHWITSHGYSLLETVGIIASLGFTAVSFQRDDRSRRISNLFALTAQRRDIWTQSSMGTPSGRACWMRRSISGRRRSPTRRRFITLLLLHLSATCRASREGIFSTQQALGCDIRGFLHLPIPNLVWQESKEFIEPDSVDFVEACQKGDLTRT